MFKQTFVIVAILMAITLGTHSTFALTAQQRSSVGFTDGCQDAGTGTSTMLNSASNAGHHSQDYMQGYYEGLNSCGPNNNQNSNNIDQNNRNQNQGQTLGQSTFCVNVFGSCPVTGGQSQGLQN